MRISGRPITTIAAAAALAAGLLGPTPTSAEPGSDAGAGASEKARSWQRAGGWATGSEGTEITSIAVDPAGRVVVARDNRRVSTYDRTGEVVSTFLAPLKPGSLDVASNGDIHLMPDPSSARAVRSMRVLGPKGRLKRTYGRGDLPGFGGFEVGDAVRRLVFADLVGVKVRVYDVATGRELDSWGEDGTEGSGGGPVALNFPGDLALMPDDRLVLADSSAGVLKVFTVGGRHIRTFGVQQFANTVQRVAYGGGRAFGLESQTSEVEVFHTADGRHQRTLRGGIRRTVDVAATADGDTVYVAGRLPSGEPGVVRWVRR